jgi:hypothetical protein
VAGKARLSRPQWAATRAATPGWGSVRRRRDRHLGRGQMGGPMRGDASVARDSRVAGRLLGPRKLPTTTPALPAMLASLAMRALPAMRVLLVVRARLEFQAMRAVRAR